jgi:fumarate hydratase subunit beta
MIGKGRRDGETRRLLTRWKGVYFGTFGGAGAFLSTRIVSADVVAFHDLGPEAVYRLAVEGFPLVVINDSHGGDLYDDIR